MTQLAVTLHTEGQPDHHLVLEVPKDSKVPETPEVYDALVERMVRLHGADSGGWEITGEPSTDYSVTLPPRDLNPETDTEAIPGSDENIAQ